MVGGAHPTQTSGETVTVEWAGLDSHGRAGPGHVSGERPADRAAQQGGQRERQLGIDSTEEERHEAPDRERGTCAPERTHAGGIAGRRVGPVDARPLVPRHHGCLPDAWHPPSELKWLQTLISTSPGTKRRRRKYR